MQQRDFLKDQIEEMSRVLGQILADFMGLKSNGQAARGIEQANMQLKSQLDLDVQTISHLDKEDLKAYVSEKNLTSAHLETLSEYFREVGTAKTNKDEAKHDLQKASDLLDIADQLSETMSFSRLSKKQKIDALLDEQE